MDLNVFKRCWNFTTTYMKMQPRGESFDEKAIYTIFLPVLTSFQKKVAREVSSKH